MKNVILYFAFGSNMFAPRMQSRCPRAIALGVAKLPNYKLVARQYADVEFEEGKSVNGVLYMITERHLKSLDAYEGYPHIYKRYWVEVNFKGTKYPALVYEMTEETKAKRDGIPYSEEYRKICSDGADFHKVPNQFKKSRIKSLFNINNLINSKGDNKPMKNILICVYGTLRKGERNHHICGDVISLKPCTIKGTLYDTGYGFPAFEPTGDNEVQAELVEITAEAWKDVDRLEGVPVLYNRKLYPCKLADDTIVEAWVYIMNELPPQAKIIKSNNWKAR